MHFQSGKTRRFDVVVPRRNQPNQVRSKIIRHVSLLVGSRVYVAGLLTFEKPLPPGVRPNNCCYLDINSFEWVWPHVKGPELRFVQAVLHDDRIIVFGSDPIEPEDREYTWELNLVTLEWTRFVYFKSLPLSPKATIAEIIEETSQVVLFGWLDNNTITNDLILLDADTHVWYYPKEIGVRPCPRDEHASCIEGSTVYIYGGKRPDGEEMLGDLHILHVSHQVCRWSTVEENPLCVSVSSAGMTVVGGKVLILGGFTRNFDDVSTFLEYDPDKSSWENVVSKYNMKKAPYAASAHRLIPLHDRLLVVGGFAQKYPWLQVICAVR